MPYQTRKIATSISPGFKKTLWVLKFYKKSLYKNRSAIAILCFCDLKKNNKNKEIANLVDYKNLQYC